MSDHARRHADLVKVSQRFDLPNSKRHLEVVIRLESDTDDPDAYLLTAFRLRHTQYRTGSALWHVSHWLTQQLAHLFPHFATYLDERWTPERYNRSMKLEPWQETIVQALLKGEPTGWWNHIRGGKSAIQREVVKRLRGLNPDALIIDEFAFAGDKPLISPL